MYESPTVEIIHFDAEDIIRTSTFVTLTTVDT